MVAAAPSRREDFHVAIICAVVTEYDAVCQVFDEFWDENGDSYGRAVGDINTYTTGRIGNHNVVLQMGKGKANAASAAASFRSSYNGLELALLVGICGGVPYAGSDGETEILLGDVVISKSVVQYDFGRQYPDKLMRKDTFEDNLSKANKNIRSLLKILETERGLEKLQSQTSAFLIQLQDKVKVKKRRGPTKNKYGYPGAAMDRLFEPSYRHKHRGVLAQACSTCSSSLDAVCENALDSSCEELGCEESYLVTRESLEEGQEPTIYIGPVASGDAVMKSGEDRDRIAKKEGIIAFEMDGAGVWEEVPCIVVKGVCDYADSHKNKKWQAFAAATAAAAAKALLERYPKTDKARSEQPAEQNTAVNGATSGKNEGGSHHPSGPVFNGPISARNLVAGVQASGGTVNNTFG